MSINRLGRKPPLLFVLIFKAFFQKYNLNFFHQVLSRKFLLLQYRSIAKYLGLHSFHRKPDGSNSLKSANSSQFAQNWNLLSPKILNGFHPINVSLDSLQVVETFAVKFICFLMLALEKILFDNGKIACRHEYSWWSNSLPF